MKQYKALVFVSAGLILAACGTNTPANLDGDATVATFSLELTSSDTQTTTKLDPFYMKNPNGTYALGESGVTIETAQMNVEAIALRLPQGLSCRSAGEIAGQGVGCAEELADEDGDGVSGESVIAIQGPYAYDLFSHVASPVFTDVTIPSGVYTRAEIRLGNSASAGQLQHRTMFAAGTFVDEGGIQHKFELRLKFAETIAIQNQTGISVSEDIDNVVSIGLDVEKWMEGIALRACVKRGELMVDGQDTLVIDEDMPAPQGDCADIVARIHANIKNCFQLQHRERAKTQSGQN